MTDEPSNEIEIVPVWTVATEEVEAPIVRFDGQMTPERLSELRSALAMLADSPIATLEAHPLPASVDRSRGIALHATSPLAQGLSDLVSRAAPKQTTSVVRSGETLYRMIVPAKVAAEFGQGLVQPMKSSAVAGGIHGALRNSTTVVSQATFVPVAGEAAAAVGKPVRLELRSPAVQLSPWRLHSSSWRWQWVSARMPSTSGRWRSLTSLSCSNS